MHICIIADDADFTDDIRQPELNKHGFIEEFALTFSENNAEMRATAIFPEVTERKISSPAFESGYSIPAAVPEMKAGPLAKQKQFIRFA